MRDLPSLYRRSSFGASVALALKVRGDVQGVPAAVVFPERIMEETLDGIPDARKKPN